MSAEELINYNRRIKRGGKEIADKIKGIINKEKTRREIFHRTLTKISDLLRGG